MIMDNLLHLFLSPGSRAPESKLRYLSTPLFYTVTHKDDALLCTMVLDNFLHVYLFLSPGSMVGTLLPGKNILDFLKMR